MKIQQQKSQNSPREMKVYQGIAPQTLKSDGTILIF